MALTIRLTDDERFQLNSIQDCTNQKTASGTVKFVLSEWQQQRDKISTIRSVNADLKYELEVAVHKLDSFRDAWKILASLAK